MGCENVGNKYLFALNAYTVLPYQKRGIATELFVFINKSLGYHLINDKILSPAGVALWNALKKSPHFTTKILDLKTRETFSLDDAGKAETKDGIIVLDPKNDKEKEYYDLKTDSGQRFFFIIETNDVVSGNYKGDLFEHQIIPSFNLKHKSSFLDRAIRWLPDMLD